MSYDVRFKDPESKDTIEIPTHHLMGGMYQIGGSNQADLNVTYNYGKHLHQVWGHGLKELDGMTAEEATAKLEQAVSALGTDRSEDYWEATAGNAGAAMADLLTIAKQCPGATVEVI